MWAPCYVPLYRHRHALAVLLRTRCLRSAASCIALRAFGTFGLTFMLWPADPTQKCVLAGGSKRTENRRGCQTQ